MSEKQTIAVVVAVIGFILLMVGSLGFMGVFTLAEWASYILMGIGIVAVIGSLIAITVLSNQSGSASMEE